jgi:hypothetical protein
MGTLANDMINVTNVSYRLLKIRRRQLWSDDLTTNCPERKIRFVSRVCIVLRDVFALSICMLSRRCVCYHYTVIFPARDPPIAPILHMNDKRAFRHREMIIKGLACMGDMHATATQHCRRKYGYNANVWSACIETRDFQLRHVESIRCQTHALRHAMIHTWELLVVVRFKLNVANKYINVMEPIPFFIMGWTLLLGSSVYSGKYTCPYLRWGEGGLTKFRWHFFRTKVSHYFSWNETVLLGRPYSGCAILCRKSLNASFQAIEC